MAAFVCRRAASRAAWSILSCFSCVSVAVDALSVLEELAGQRMLQLEQRYHPQHQSYQQATYGWPRSAQLASNHLLQAEPLHPLGGLLGAQMPQRSRQTQLQQTARWEQPGGRELSPASLLQMHGGVTPVRQRRSDDVTPSDAATPPARERLGQALAEADYVSRADHELQKAAERIALLEEQKGHGDEELQRATERIAQLEKQAQFMRNVAQDEQQRRQQNQQHLGQIQLDDERRLRDSEAQSQAALVQLSSLREEVSKQLRENQDTNQRAQSQLVQLRSQSEKRLQQSEEKLRASQQRLEESEKLNHAWEESGRKARAILDALRRERADAEARLKRTKAEDEGLTMRLQDSEQRNEVLRSQIDKLAADRTETESKLKRADDNVKSSEDKLRKVYEADKAVMLQIQQQRAQEKDQVQGIAQRLQSSEQQRERLQGEVLHLRQLHDKEAASLRDSEQKLQQIRQGLQKSEAKNFLLRAQLVTQQKKEEARLAETEQQLRQAQQRLEASESKSRLLYARLQNYSEYLQQNQKGLQERAEDEKLLMLEVSGRLRDGQSKIQLLQTRLATLLNERKSDKAHLQAYETASVMMQQRLNATQLEGQEQLRASAHALAASERTSAEQRAALEASEAKGRQLEAQLAQSRQQDERRLLMLQQKISHELEEDERRLNASETRAQHLEHQLQQQRLQGEHLSQASKKLLMAGQDHLHQAAEQLKRSAAQNNALEAKLKVQTQVAEAAQAEAANESKLLSASTDKLMRLQGLLNTTQAQLVTNQQQLREQQSKAKRLAVLPLSELLQRCQDQCFAIAHGGACCGGAGGVHRPPSCLLALQVAAGQALRPAECDAAVRSDALPPGLDSSSGATAAASGQVALGIVGAGEQPGRRAVPRTVDASALAPGPFVGRSQVERPRVQLMQVQPTAPPTLERSWDDDFLGRRLHAKSNLDWEDAV